MEDFDVSFEGLFGMSNDLNRVLKAIKALENMSQSNNLESVFKGNPFLSDDTFEFTNMYDGCILPQFDTYGWNNPCPNYQDLVNFGSRIEYE